MQSLPSQCLWSTTIILSAGSILTGRGGLFLKRPIHQDSKLFVCPFTILLHSPYVIIDHSLWIFRTFRASCHQSFLHRHLLIFSLSKTQLRSPLLWKALTDHTRRGLFKLTYFVMQILWWLPYAHQTCLCT